MAEGIEQLQGRVRHLEQECRFMEQQKERNNKMADDKIQEMKQILNYQLQEMSIKFR